MVTQYPHTVTISTVADSTQDSNGNFQAGSPSSSSFKARFETNTKSLFLTAADGKQLVYSGIIYAPLSTPDVELGASVIVLDGMRNVAKGNVLQFSRGQKNVRVWI
jgi:hypothetical protein